MTGAITTLGQAHKAFAVYVPENYLMEFDTEHGASVTPTTINLDLGLPPGWLGQLRNPITVCALDPATHAVRASATANYDVQTEEYWDCLDLRPSYADDFPGLLAPALEVGKPRAIDATPLLASREGGEPLHGGHVVPSQFGWDSPVAGSYWWHWDAPNDLDGSTLLHVCVQGKYPIVAVYTGDSVANLHEIASNTDGLSEGASHVDFVPAAGKRYSIAVVAQPPSYRFFYGSCDDVPESYPCPPPPIPTTAVLTLLLDKADTHASRPANEVCLNAATEGEGEGEHSTFPWSCFGGST